MSLSDSRTDPAGSRREFLQLMGASLALGGLNACTRQPRERILPHARSPEHRLPGRPVSYATAMTVEGAALGLLVESHEGRPTKVEGNPDHPSSLGATDAIAQAAVLSLYDPDRSRTVLEGGRISTWDAFRSALDGALRELPSDGDGLALLTPPVLSPTLAGQLERLLAARPATRVSMHDPLESAQAAEGAQLAFGREVTVVPRLERAGVVLSLDADFLGYGPGRVRAARELARRRRPRRDDPGDARTRLYVVESTHTITGAFADHRLALRPNDIEGLARAVARSLGVDVAAPRLEGRAARHAEAVAAALDASRGRALVIAGPWQSAAVHALAHVLNDRLGRGADAPTVEYLEPLAFRPPSAVPISDLADAMRAGDVRLLVMLAGNPVYDAPADVAFAEALATVPLRVHHGLEVDETSHLCQWHLPATHFLESWSDTRAHEGTASIVQPLIAPLFHGRSEHELVALVAGEGERSGHELVREHWRAALSSGGESEDSSAFDGAWRRALHDGLVAESAPATLALTPRADLDVGEPPGDPGELVIAFRPDANVLDGRFANNAWMQETPRPLTRLVWDNAAILHPRTAGALGAGTGDVIELTVAGRSVGAPVWTSEDAAEDVVAVQLGYGRVRAGSLGTGVGFDAFRLRASDAPWHAPVRARATGGRHELVTVQTHRRMEGRDIVRTHAPGEGPSTEPAHGDPATLFTPHASGPPGEHAWGMVIDLAACIGCNACMVACQAENNVPVVGKREVALGREMHWLRVDVYDEGEGETRVTHHQPVPCMHCETAPCELVCPVAATVHSAEGLNDMVYNRCVGTRYCSNNCPYKVRRFNFYRYADDDELLALGRNPDVTVRTRGVMEKCTYCVQRIERARIDARVAGRPLRDGDVVTACQQVCPAEAIVFGDLADPGSRVSLGRAEPRNYGLLAELGTRPRTTYLAKLTNSDPRLRES